MWTVTVLTPQSIAFLATSSAATVAANGVLLRDPLNPFAPALAHARVFPSGSVIVMIVLLKVAWMWATPTGTFRRTFLFPFFFGVAIVPPRPLFLRGFLLLGDGALPRPLPGARVGVGALAAGRQPLAVPQPPVAPQIHQPLDVHGDFLAKVPLDAVVRVDDVPDPRDLVFRQRGRPQVRRNARLRQDFLGGRRPDPVDVGQGRPDLLRLRNVHSRYACQSNPSWASLAAPIPGAACAWGSRRGSGRPLSA